MRKPTKPRSAGKHDVEIGRRIRLRRVELGMSQAELGDKLGVSFQQIQKREKGVNRTSGAQLQQTATALDVPVTFFYDGEVKPITDQERAEIEAIPMQSQGQSAADPTQEQSPSNPALDVASHQPVETLHPSVNSTTSWASPPRSRTKACSVISCR